MQVHWTRTVEPVIEPLSLADARLHCRVDGIDDDIEIDRFRLAARTAFENYANRGVMTQTWKHMLADWLPEIWLPMAAPLQSVTVQYYDASGALQTLSSSYYVVDTTSEPGRVTLAPNYSWPQLQSGRLTGRVVITYVVGWTSPYAVPAPIVQGMRLLVGHFYDNRSAVNVGNIVTKFPLGVEALWAPYRVWYRVPVGSC